MTAECMIQDSGLVLRINQELGLKWVEEGGWLTVSEEPHRPGNCLVRYLHLSTQTSRIYSKLHLRRLSLTRKRVKHTYPAY